MRLEDYKIVRNEEKFTVMEGGCEVITELKRLEDTKTKLRLLGVNYIEQESDKDSIYTISGYHTQIRNYTKKVIVVKWEFLEKVNFNKDHTNLEIKK